MIKNRYVRMYRCKTLVYCRYRKRILRLQQTWREFVAVSWSHEILFSPLHGRWKPHARTAITCDFIQNGVHTSPLAAMFHLSCHLWHVCDWLWQLSHCRAAHLCDKVQMHAIKSNLFHQCDFNCMRLKSHIVAQVCGALHVSSVGPSSCLSFMKGLRSLLKTFH